MEKKVLYVSYQKYGYKMFDCSIEQMEQYLTECYNNKIPPDCKEKFSYLTFLNVVDGIEKINSIFIPQEHKNLPKTVWSLQESNQLLIKEIWFYSFDDRHLYQSAVERAWALGGHLDIRVEQHYYD